MALIIRYIHSLRFFLMHISTDVFICMNKKRGSFGYFRFSEKSGHLRPSWLNSFDFSLTRQRKAWHPLAGGQK